MRRGRPRHWLLLAGLVMSLAGCAGPPTQRRASIEALAVDAAEAERLISAYRHTHDAGDVTADPALMVVAQRQADAMASADELSHTVDGTLPERLALSGADRRAAVENVSAGYGTLEAALGGWRRSPAHDANLLFGPMRRMGIGASMAPGTRYKTFWALVMTD